MSLATYPNLHHHHHMQDHPQQSQHNQTAFAEASSPEPIYAYYGTNCGIAGASGIAATGLTYESCPTETSPSYFSTWPFTTGVTAVDELSPPGSTEYSPPPYTPSPGQSFQRQTEQRQIPDAPPPHLTISGMTLGLGGRGLSAASAELLGFLSSGVNAALEPGGCKPERGVKRRVTANRKERRRTQSINNAFADLRDCIPNVPADTKLSKIKTLRLATSYIAYLMDLLAQDEYGTTTVKSCSLASIPQPSLPLEGHFKSEVTKKYESRDDKRKRDNTGSLVAGSVQEKKSKGRTGWPQHVWALELQQDA